MRAYDIIKKKRDGYILTKEEIDWFVRGVSDQSIPDYQVAAWAMAVYFKGMDARETTDLTVSMANSGEVVDLSAIPGVKVDKHSTGGVADTATLVVAPLVAACGVPVAKMSGRGLGHTGGTLDKLESIPGFSTALSREQFMQQVRDVGIAVAAQTGELAPADKRLYALRDVTATIESLPLIASSVMSKKLAAGADAIVLDVKFGSGAFMKTQEDAQALAEAMVAIGELAGKRTVALVTSMEQPLGMMVGNSLEVYEAIEILAGRITRGDLLEVSLLLASEMIVLAGVASDIAAAFILVKQALASGQALEKMKQFIAAQGGDPDVCDNSALLPQASLKTSVTLEKAGWLSGMDAEKIGIASLLLGAGRSRKEDEIDPSVGIEIKKRIGDRIESSEDIAIFYSNGSRGLQEAVDMFKNSLIISDSPCEKPILVAARIDGVGL